MRVPIRTAADLIRQESVYGPGLMRLVRDRHGGLGVPLTRPNI